MKVKVRIKTLVTVNSLKPGDFFHTGEGGLLHMMCEADTKTRPNGDPRELPYRSVVIESPPTHPQQRGALGYWDGRETVIPMTTDSQVVFTPLHPMPEL